MTLELYIQRIVDHQGMPSDEQIYNWVTLALKSKLKESPELTVRITDTHEIQALNHEYRGKNKPTNVLSFPFEAMPGMAVNLLGDVVLCAEVVEAEAKEQNKTPTAHWAHIIIHGCLHLLGYDHISEKEADEMEGLEIALLEQLGYNNPYILHKT
jgi:probable rRNA maturation factor